MKLSIRSERNTTTRKRRTPRCANSSWRFPTRKRKRKKKKRRQWPRARDIGFPPFGRGRKIRILRTAALSSRIRPSDAVRRFQKFRLFRDGAFLRIQDHPPDVRGAGFHQKILLQGISGTGKTSLPYAMGKFFLNDATIASVQPSWRDRTELFGYFNDLLNVSTKRTFLKRIYEAFPTTTISILSFSTK